MMSWDDLKFWQSKEWQTIQERLDDLDHEGTPYNPKRENLFAALDYSLLEETKVMIIGQDPYPKAEHATGVAFSVPKKIKILPPTLINIFDEYHSDLHYPIPANGDLTPWAKQGVLLWNSVPMYYAKHPAYPEWQLLTVEIVEELSKTGIVFVLLGGKARDFRKNIDEEISTVIETSHPSPLGSRKGPSPFTGSRLFSTINVKLREQGLPIIKWQL